jgi:FtsP/CotA-like multicopper oxidase with cupredoxin domain
MRLISVIFLAALPVAQALHEASVKKLHRSDDYQSAAANDNRTPAGTYVQDTLVLRLTVSQAIWRILGDSNPGFKVAAFAEEGKTPSIPAPLLRVKAGTPIHVIVRNPLDDTLTLRGFSERGGVNDSLVVLPAASAEVAFVARRPGTYHYWGGLAASQRAVPLPLAVRHTDLFRPRFDSQLAGAFIVDPPGAVADDRIFVITGTVDQTPPVRLDVHGAPARQFFAMNGRSWPYTERLHYALHDSVRWRIINTTFQTHPMHLHGFYFRVDSHGSALTGIDSIYAPEQRRSAVTEAIATGETVSLVWSPDRPGGWVFHCHVTSHAAKTPPVDQPNTMDYPDTHDHGDPDHHVMTGMNGLVLGITVTGKAAPRVAWRPAKRLRLYVQSDSTAGDSVRHFGYVLQRGAKPKRDSVESPGPTLLLTRGEPTSILVINHLLEPTSVHGHGIELESYYDGVVGWSGAAGGAGPTERAIRPDSSFEVHIVPRRAGTFMYHTHYNDIRQQSGGLVGALIVLEPGERFDSTRDLVFLVSDVNQPPVAMSGPIVPQLNRVLINGSRNPQPKELRAGGTYRIRVGNLATFRPLLVARVRRDSSVVSWRPVAKDGFTLPAGQATVRPASGRVSSGETEDFSFTPDTPGELRLEFGVPTRTGFEVQGTVRLIVRDR